jgi:hypothetical protein
MENQRLQNGFQNIGAKVEHHRRTDTLDKIQDMALEEEEEEEKQVDVAKAERALRLRDRGVRDAFHAIDARE